MNRRLVGRVERVYGSDGMWLVVGVACVFAAVIVGGVLGNLLTP